MFASSLDPRKQNILSQHSNTIYSLQFMPKPTTSINQQPPYVSETFNPGDIMSLNIEHQLHQREPDLEEFHCNIVKQKQMEKKLMMEKEAVAVAEEERAT